MAIYFPGFFLFFESALVRRFVRGRDRQKGGDSTARRRIISVAPSVTETLFALGLGERIVGVSSYCNFPPEARGKEKVGGYITPSMEKILSLHPDLVFQTADGDLKTFVNRLAGLWNSGLHHQPPVRSRDPERGFEDRRGNVFFAGGPDPRGGDAGENDRGPGKSRRTAAPSSSSRHVGGPADQLRERDFRSRPDRLAGGENIAADGKGKHPLLSMEEVVTRDPQVIILSSMLSNEPMTARSRRWGDTARYPPCARADPGDPGRFDSASFSADR